MKKFVIFQQTTNQAVVPKRVRYRTPVCDEESKGASVASWKTIKSTRNVGGMPKKVGDIGITC